ncbi:exo-alpha-sialidase [Larkinella punicea]|uniref:exo-alpha-sialidase n=1 Tax=Larkinella punicea TaxID=2315727 RepID=UPI001E2B4B13|nr:exo-alpha-sialidase [Larkinella punicea]
MKTLLNPYFFLLPVFFCSLQAQAQTGSPAEPVRYIGGETVDPSVHEGRLRYAVGVESRQTLRVNHTHPELADNQGWTYNHASNLCYWNNTFYQQYLSNPVDEHIAPGQTLVITSKDGRQWGKPEVVFPPYVPPTGVTIPDSSNGYMMHQRMGFYVAPNGRLLVLAFYGHTEDPFGQGGIGRVVREAYKDGTYGPIYFIRYSSHPTLNGIRWNETNTSYPFYKKATDTGFLDACNALLSDKLMTFQWWDEDRGLDGFYGGKKAREALSYYHRKDGKVVALWKRSHSALSSDNGLTFSDPVKVPTLIMAGGKQWGQRTDDGRYAICYNPIEMDEHRFPLALITGDDGILFDNLLIVQGEVPPRRFFGRWKDFGPCYVRGIEEGNGNPPGNDLWLTYSMNKEDIWISRVPTPVRYAVSGPVMDSFDGLTLNGGVPDWNIYAPKWAPVSVVNTPGATGKCLELSDKDPYDYARAIRVFEEGNRIETKLRIQASQNTTGMLEIDLTDRYGNRPVRLRFDEKGSIVATDGSTEKHLQAYKPGQWYDLTFRVNASPNGNYDLAIDGKTVLEKAALAEAVKSVERLSVRTGPYRDLPNRKTPNEEPGPPLPGADEAVTPAVYYLDDVLIKSIK